MIKMKSLTSGNLGDGGTKVRRGREFSVAMEGRAKELESAGLAYRVDVKAEKAPLNKMEPPPANKAAGAGPLENRGGTTGAEAPAPSLPLDPPQRRRRSRSSRDESES
jgi:hypothetical protein